MSRTKPSKPDADLPRFTFDAWPPPASDIKHGVRAPLGAIRLQRNDAGSRTRYIKVTHAGRGGQRWMMLARYWWLVNMGPIPPGQRIIRLDGDTLNDNPHNLALGTAGDAIAMRHMDDPDWSAKQHRKAAAACTRRNNEYAQARRSIELFPTRWYAVDVAGGRIINEPRRMRHQLVAATGFSVDGRNWRAIAGQLLGFPGLDRAQALVLDRLLTADRMRFDALLSAVRERAAWWAWPILTEGSVRAAMSGLRQRGLLITEKRWHRATEKAIATRGPVWPYIAVRGDRLLSDVLFEGVRLVPLPAEITRKLQAA